MFQHILLPTDGSAHSQRALVYARELAKRYRSRVTVLHAYELREVLLTYRKTLADPDLLLQELDQISAELVQAATQKLLDAGLEASPLLIQGRAKYAIVDAIDDCRIDLVVMASQGWSPLKGVLIGSVSQYVLHHAQCPVLLIH